MKIQSPALALLLVLGITTAFGQDYAFKVLVNKGKNEVKSGTSWMPLKVGASLTVNDELRVPENAYIGLVHADGKPLEVKDAGVHKVVDLSAKVNKGSGSVLNTYTTFILSTNEKRKNTMLATGAVHRGPDKVAVYLPPNSFYCFGDSITISWEKQKAIPPPYEITLSNVWSDELLKLETSDTVVTINLNKDLLAKSNDIIITVVARNAKKSSDQFILRKFTGGDKERITEAYNEVAPLLAGNTALNQRIKAGFFEEKKLLADAATAFLQALALQPDNTSLREDFESFLLRNGLKAPSDK